MNSPSSPSASHQLLLLLLIARGKLLVQWLLAHEARHLRLDALLCLLRLKVSSRSCLVLALHGGGGEGGG